MANDYVTAAQLKAEMPDTSWGSTYDTLLALCATQASRLIDAYCMQEPGWFAAGNAAARYFTGCGEPHVWVTSMAAAPTAVAVAETGIVDDASGSGGSYTAWASSDYLLWPYNAAAEGRPYLRLDLNVLGGSKTSWFGYAKGIKITARWGYSLTAPDAIYRAALIEGIRLFKRASAAQQDKSGKGDLGKLSHPKQLDPVTELLLSGYKRITT